MPKRIALVARDAFQHDGRSVVRGEVFDATPIQAAALVYRHRAVFADTAERDEAPASKRTYHRRDMVPER